MTLPDDLQGNPYVTWDAFPSERKGRGIGASRPMGMVCVRVCETDVYSGRPRTVEVPSDVARRLASLRKEQPEGSEIRFKDLLDSIMQTQYQSAKERILRLVNRRDYSRYELEKRLAREGYDSDISAKVLDGLAEYGIVSDSRFAEIYVRSKISAGWGIERIVRELEMRGIDVNDLAGWPYDFVDPDKEYERAVMVAQKKCSGSRKPTYQQLAKFLVGRGFSYAVACGAAKVVA